MKIQVYIGETVGATADGKLLREIPPFFPKFESGIHELDTQNMPEDIRLEFEKALKPYILD